MRLLPVLTITITLALLSERALATCSCFFEMQASETSRDTSLTSDPGYSPAAAVFIVRDGLKTVLTVETAYKGPRVPLSMVFPVPTSIEREQVRTVPGSLFRNLDRRTAPRVQHLFPPCPQRRRRMRATASLNSLGGGGSGGGSVSVDVEEPPVEVVDEWELDEYDIAVLDASQSVGLMTFLAERGLELPAEAEPLLRGYIEGGQRFVFATVDPSRAHLIGDETMVLSPLQLEFESTDLQVPVRLGTLNSPGEQEVLIYVLSRDGRYEVANRPDAVAPTDVRLNASAAGSMAELYSTLMDEQFRQTPGAVVTEFSHRLGSRVGYHNVARFGLSNEARRQGRWTLTRMRHRYGKNLQDDLVLRPAEEPLRMTRRYRTAGARVWAPRGASGFHVRFVVEHRSCMSNRQQRSLVRRFAIAESMWSQSERPWPGDLIRDDIESLSITAGSSAPEGWPTAPTPVVVPPPVAQAGAPEAADVVVTEGSPESTPAETVPMTDSPSAASPMTPAASPAVPEASGGMCTVSPGQEPLSEPLAVFALAVGVVCFRRSKC